MRQHDGADRTEHDRQLEIAWRTHAPVALRFATAMVGPADAHDVTTTAFLRVTRQPGWTEIVHLDRYLMRAIRKPVHQSSPMGPLDAWPTGGGGFEYFYGFISGETSQYYPAIYEGTTPLEPPKSPEAGYHITEDMTDKAIAWVRQQKSLMPDRPFFTYFAGRARRTHPIMCPRSGSIAIAATSMRDGTRCGTRSSSARRRSA